MPFPDLPSLHDLASLISALAELIRALRRR